jgi:hypothetical protein
MITGTIHDLPTIAPVIDPVQLAAINAAWLHNAIQLGWFCLVVGFLIGLATMYLYYLNKDEYGDI